MEFLWESYWNFMEILWNFYGIFMEFFMGILLSRWFRSMDGLEDVNGRESYILVAVCKKALNFNHTLGYQIKT